VTFTVDPDHLPLQRLYRWERERATEIHLTQPLGDTVRDWTWAQTLEEARRIAAWLRAQGFEPGSRIGLYSKNCAWWLIADYAIWIAGHVSVPIFPTLTPASARQVLEHSASRACIVGRVDNWDLARTGIPERLPVLAFPGSPATDAVQWEDVLAQQAPLTGTPTRPGDDIATLIYTSGTTGAPKGVMHSFNTFAAVTRCLAEHPNIGVHDSDRLFCYLALAHVAERAIIEANAVYAGMRVYFNDNLQTFAADLARARPSIFFAVPRLWTMFQLGVFKRTPEGELRKRIDDPQQGHAVRQEILEGMGLEHCRFAAGSGATMPPSLLAWYEDLGLDIVEGYGMTENFGCCATNAPGDNRRGTVGRPWPGVDLRISGEGEIQMRAPWVMQGYFRDPERTRETFTGDGWLKTGDKGALDDDGRLRITGRIKEIFKTAKGKYVAPAAIENRLMTGGLIEAACVTGSDRPQPLALLMLSQTTRDALHSDATRKQQLEAQLRQQLETINDALDPHERLECLVVVSDAWTQDSGHLTGTMKLRRDAIEASYAAHFDAWAAQRSAVVWQGS
jgi:long-chain acyl-CoA synthetase